MTRFCLALMALFMLSGCAEVQYMAHLGKQIYPENNSASANTTASAGTFKVGNPYKVDGQWYYPKEQYDLVETGIASWYGPGFDGRRTASGEIYHSDELTAAHRTLQMPSLVRVTNLDNGRSIIVRVNDRGPYKRGRVMDMSEKAATLLGYRNIGTAKVRIEVLTQESQRIAQAAKGGTNTRGYELALNGQGSAVPPQDGSYKVASLQPVSHQPLPDVSSPVPGHIDGGTFYPDPVVTTYPVAHTGIYVQAGSFTLQANAQNLGNSLKALGKVAVYQANVAGKQFYRVRLGPVADVGQADALLAKLASGGHNQAIIVVE